MKLLSEVHRMRILAGLINESNENIQNQIQVWFDLDGVLADMDGALNRNSEMIALKGKLDNLVKDKFPEWSTLSNDELKEKYPNVIFSRSFIKSHIIILQTFVVLHCLQFVFHVYCKLHTIRP